MLLLCNIIIDLEIDLCLLKLAANEVVLTLLEKYKATLVGKTSIVTFFVNVRIWLLYFFEGAKIFLDYPKEMK